MKLELRNIEKSFGAKQVLQGISLTAEGGQAFGLLGRNGAGKTTTIRILMDVFPQNSGEVLLDGKPIDYRKVSLEIGRASWWEIGLVIGCRSRWSPDH